MGTPQASARRRLARRLAVGAVVLGGFGLAATVVSGGADELTAAADALHELRWGWVVLAVAAEIGSYGLRGWAQSVILRRGLDARPGVGGPGCTRVAEPTRRLVSVPDPTPRTGLGPATMAATICAGDAAAYCLPLGFAASGAVQLRVLRRRAVPMAVAGWTFAVGTVIYLAAIGLLGLLATGVAGLSPDVQPITGMRSMTLILLATVSVIGLGYLGLRRQARHAARSGREHPWRTRCDRTRIGRAFVSWADQLTLVTLPAVTVAAVLALMLGSWLADITVLGLAYPALGATPPWAGLLLAYCAGQIAGALPLTPGGIGAVEGSLTLALVAFGGAQTITLAAVLLYRLIAYWATIPTGAGAWLALRKQRRGPGTQPSAYRHDSARTRLGRRRARNSSAVNARGQVYRRATAITLGVVAVLCATGCAGPAGAPRPLSDPGCAPALPLAAAAVGHRGELILIRNIGPDDLTALRVQTNAATPPKTTPPSEQQPPPPPAVEAPGPKPAKTCLIVYHGDYPPGSPGTPSPGAGALSGAASGASAPDGAGLFALFVVHARHPTIEQVILTPTLPPAATPTPWWQRIF